jgi:hypothetical protein
LQFPLFSLQPELSGHGQFLGVKGSRHDWSSQGQVYEAINCLVDNARGYEIDGDADGG